MKALPILGGSVLVLIATYAVLKHEPVQTRVILSNDNVRVRISVVGVSKFDQWLNRDNSLVEVNKDNRSAIGPDGHLPQTKVGAVTVAAWDRVYTIPPEMVRDCFGPRQNAADWKLKSSTDGIYIGTMVGDGEGKTLVWWRAGSDQSVTRWMFPMQEKRDLTSLPKATDEPVETRRLVSFDD